MPPMEKLNDTERTAFNRLAYEHKKTAGDEIRELNEWYTASKNDLEQRLKQEKRWKEGGLDSNQQHFSDVIKEYKKRFKTIQKKYGIAPVQQQK